MIDRDEMLETAKACGMKFAPAQFSGVLEAEVSEFDLEAYTKVVTQKAKEIEREACASVASNPYFGNPGEVGSEVAEAIRARGTGGEG